MAVLSLTSIKKTFLNEWVLSTVFMTVVFLLVNHGLLTGNAVGIWDADGQFMPYQILVSDQAREGKFLLWDMWSNGGVPVSGDPQMGVFSPLNVIIGFLTGGSTVGFVVYWLFVWWIGGCGIMILGWHFKVPVWGTLVVALEFLFIGIYITNAEHTAWIVGFSFIPLIIWRLDVAVDSKRLLPAIQAGALWGLSGLGGYPACTVLTLIYCGLWGVGRVLLKDNVSNELKQPLLTKLKELRKELIKFALVIFLFTLVGTIILSPTYFSFLYDGAGTTTRVGALSRDAVIYENPFHLGAISTFASPFLPLQKFYNSGFWVGTDISMTSIYAGIITFLALYAILNKKKEKWRWWLLLMALMALSFSLSQILPFRGWLYDFFYPTRFFRHSSVFRMYYLFSITILALLGIRDLSESLLKKKLFSQWRNYKISSVIIASSAILVFISVINSLSALGGKIRLAYLHLFTVWIGICLIPYLTSKFSYSKQNIVVPLCLILLTLFDIFCIYRISNPMMMSDDASLVKRWQKLDQQHSANLDMTSFGLYRQESSCYEENLPCKNLNNDQMIKKIPVFNSYATQINNYQVEIAKNSVLKNMAIGDERIWFSPKAAHLAPTMESFSSFVENSNLSNNIPLIIHTSEEMLNPNNKSDKSDFEQILNERLIIEGDLKDVPVLQKKEARLLKYTPTEMVFEVDAPTDGWLLVTDRWARSWKVEINALPSPVFGGNFIFRAIPVLKGNNHIHFYYQLAAFPYLLIISWGTLLLIICVTIFLRIKTKRKNYHLAFEK